MSLINDALKRATNLRRKENVPLPEGMPPLPNANHGGVGKGQGKVIILGAVFVAVLGYFAWNQFGGGQVEVVTKVQASKDTNKLAKAGVSPAPAPASAIGNSTNVNPIARAAKIAEGIRAANAEGDRTADGLNANGVPNASGVSVGASEQKASGVAIPSEAKVAALEEPVTSDAQGSVSAVSPKVPAAAPSHTAQTDAANADFPSVQLQAIYFRIRNPLAVVNGKTMREGEEINGVKIAQIAHNEVRMEYQGLLKTVSLR